MMEKWTNPREGFFARRGGTVKRQRSGYWLAETGNPIDGLYAETAMEGMNHIDSVLDRGEYAAATRAAFGKSNAATMAEGLKIDVTDPDAGWASMCNALRDEEAMNRDRPSHPLPGYGALYVTLCDAYRQAATGKGKERHTDGGSVPFEQQPIMTITREQGLGFPLGQTMKKALEANRMAKQGKHAAAEAELLGAIVYAAAAVLRLREMAEDDDDDFEDVKIGGTG